MRFDEMLLLILIGILGRRKTSYLNPGVRKTGCAPLIPEGWIYRYT